MTLYYGDKAADRQANEAEHDDFRSPYQRGGIIFDAPKYVPAIWGVGHDVLWSEGEPLIIAGPPGVGKTTIAQQLALALAGVGPAAVFGFPVTPTRGRTLYVAADRPKQALRSFRRMVWPDHRSRLDAMLVIWTGPFNALADRERFLAELRDEGIGTVIFDSIKDVAGDVSDGNVGAEFNRTMQILIAAGIEVVALHHNRKAQEGNRKPKRLDDLYGSTWIAAGAGSVVYLFGEAGDCEVELLHLKQPDDVVGPLTVVHDHERGISTVLDEDAEEREALRVACVAVLDEVGHPLGRDPLLKRARDRGIEGSNERLRDLLTAIAKAADSGIDSTDAGYVKTPLAGNRGQGPATPPAGPGREAPSPPTGVENGAIPGRAAPANPLFGDNRNDEGEE